MAKAQGNNYNNGNLGKVWINGLPILDCYKARIEKKINYEKIDNPRLGSEGGKVRVPNEWTVEVELTFKKTSDNANINWSSEDIELILTDTNINGELIETKKAAGITFDTTSILKFEKGSVSEIIMSGEAEEMQDLV